MLLKVNGSSSLKYHINVDRSCKHMYFKEQNEIMVKNEYLKLNQINLKLNQINRIFEFELDKIEIQKKKGY